VSTVQFPRPFSPFQAARDEYLLAIEMEGLSPATVQKYRGAITRFARFAGEVDPATIDATLLRRFTKQVADDGRTTSTQATYLIALKRWLTWLADEGGYGVDARSFVRAKAPRVIQEPIVPLTEAEIARVVAAVAGQSFRAQRLRAMIMLLLDTGIRQSEILGLRIRDLDLEAGEITVRPITDKTRKGRTIALGRRGKLEMSRWWNRHRYREDRDCTPDAPLFIQHSGDAITRDGFQMMLKRLSWRLHLHLHPHKFRHTFAILALRGGMNPFVLQHILGHRDLTMTKRYLAIVDADVRDAKRANSPLDKIKF